MSKAVGVIPKLSPLNLRVRGVLGIGGSRWHAAAARRQENCQPLSQIIRNGAFKISRRTPLLFYLVCQTPVRRRSLGGGFADRDESIRRTNTSGKEISDVSLRGFQQCVSGVTLASLSCQKRHGDKKKQQATT
ncbi:hypothetical protein SKAU_G00116080 [Synaphobranchus kaupii]|uniref:Uncharacterized protein n=1 Tax=Synaphobranchus kaupii TaxID=118154 RepID=A0A9Q1IZS5_SYNKA|nr:hypothetical protein SKAU_G00116080 [Synaphobranchus kaupii]